MTTNVGAPINRIEKIKKGNLINKDGSVMKHHKLGNPNGFGDYQKLGVSKIKLNAQLNKANLQAMDIVCSSRAKGMTYKQIVDKLNQLQYTTRYGKAFNPIQVQRLFKRCEE